MKIEQVKKLFDIIHDVKLEFRDVQLNTDFHRDYEHDIEIFDAYTLARIECSGLSKFSPDQPFVPTRIILDQDDKVWVEYSS